MPRLTNPTHFEQHLLLRRVWLEHRQIFSLLEPHEQFQLHDFFQPAINLTESQLVQHRQSITKSDPSLPARAGKLYAKLEQSLLQALTSSPTKKATAGPQSRVRTTRKINNADQLRLRPVTRPEIDSHRLANIFVELAKQDLIRQGLLKPSRDLPSRPADDDSGILKDAAYVLSINSELLGRLGQVKSHLLS